MIKVSLMYPYSPDGKFDHEYYKNRHLPLIQEKMGRSCLKYTIDRGVCGDAPNTNPLYIACCHIYSDSIESFYAGFGPHRREIIADVIHYTNISPQMQISDVV
ncbi:EthD family reductase [Zhongshania sp.]|uniref:EthD family reductase n=1 Tax=Zhongshania sp. TaxID=1971902 RepID=UPI00356B610E